MAQTGYTPILIYSSSTTSNVPAAGNLTNSTLGSELAINITDGKLFYKDNANAIQVIGWKTTPTTAGGTGLTSYTAGDLLYYASGTTLSKLAIGTSGQWLGSSGSAPQWNSPAALTKTDDTNVTLTLGGSASTALLNAASLTLGWTGQLAASRGGTGIGTYTAGDLLYASGTTTLSKLAIGTANYVLTSSGSAPQWTAGSSVSVGTASNLLSNATSGVMQIVGPAASTTRVMTIPNANFTAARTDAGQTFTGTQTFSSDASINGLTVGKGASSLSANTAFGVNALSSATSGNYSTAIGYNALKSQTTGSINTAVGQGALENNDNSYNVAVGNNALNTSTNGYRSVAIGYSALSAMTSGYDNTAIGYNAGSTATTGNNNGFFGNGAAPSAVGVSNEYTYGNSSVTKHRFPGGNVTATTFNGSYMGAGSLRINASQTKTITVAVTGTPNALQIGFGGDLDNNGAFWGVNYQVNGSMVLGSTYSVATTNSYTSSATFTISAVTKNSNNFTFTVTNSDATYGGTIQYYFISASNGAVTVS